MSHARASALVGVLAAAIASGSVRSAHAEGEGGKQRVAVVKLAFEGGVPEAARDLFAQRLAEGLTAVRFEVISGAMVRERLAAAGLPADSCAGGSCTARAAQALGVAFLVYASVVEHEKTYDVTLELVNGRSGVSIGTNRERCEICGVEEASEKVSLAASALRARLEALANTPARFIIRAKPSRARVTLDGEAIGPAPIDREIPAGVHKLELAAEGYDVLERTITAVNGVDETLDLELVVQPSKFPLRAMGWLALGVGVAAIAGGAWAEHVDGQELACDVAAQDDHGRCPRLRNTRVLGAVLAGVGAASATLGGVWLYLGGLGAARAPEGAEHAAVVGVSGRF
ncbi:MAG TPA: PEGA domain-containing protein [Polyangia bacterium]|nr:PEGA domain-containing protein [Polyangia bacterium]